MHTTHFPINLGDEVRDKVTGFTGIVICLSEWFNGCLRASVQPPYDTEKKQIPNVEGFDVEQLEVITAKKAERTPKQVMRETNGPMDLPVRREV